MLIDLFAFVRRRRAPAAAAVKALIGTQPTAEAHDVVVDDDSFMMTPTNDLHPSTGHLDYNRPTCVQQTHTVYDAPCIMYAVCIQWTVYNIALSNEH